MPTISRFFGIVIFMNYNDHLPPHFHARYQDQEVTVEIEKGLGTRKDVTAGIAHDSGVVGNLPAGANDKLGARQDAAIPSVRSTLSIGGI